MHRKNSSSRTRNRRPDCRDLDALYPSGTVARLASAQRAIPCSCVRDGDDHAKYCENHDGDDDDDEEEEEERERREERGERRV